MCPAQHEKLYHFRFDTFLGYEIYRLARFEDESATAGKSVTKNGPLYSAILVDHVQYGKLPQNQSLPPYIGYFKRYVIYIQA